MILYICPLVNLSFILSCVDLLFFLMYVFKGVQPEYEYIDKVNQHLTAITMN